MVSNRIPPLRIVAAALAVGFTGACGTAPDGARPVERPTDVPALHHVGLNTVDAERALRWYLDVWPAASRSEVDGKPSVEAEMYLVFTEVDDPPGGAFDPELGRPAEQSAFWHIGAFVNTTDDDDVLGALGIDHLPLWTDPDGAYTWRSGLAPYAGIRTADGFERDGGAPPRPGGFSYLVAPDGVLFERTGGPNTDPAMSHVHLFHEAPRCAANWYVETLGMSLPPVRSEDGSTSPRPPWDPCDAEVGAAGWPSLERAGTIREPRATVLHGNGSFSWYPRQCRGERCGGDRPLVPSRGQALDHVGLRVDDVDPWHAWLVSRGVTILEPPHAFDGGRAVMIEGPDRLALELVEVPR